PPIDTHGPFTSIADANGHFVNTDFTVNAQDVGVTFTVTATGQSSGLTASVQFTDDSNIDCSVPCMASLKAGNVPSSGTASVDGVEGAGEWSASDLWANMYVAGDPSKPLLSKAYVKFVCNA